MKNALIIPAYNEELTIGQTMAAFWELYPDLYIYVIDNNSRDRTAEIADAFLVEHNAKGAVLFEKSQGKGRAVRRAFHEIEADIYIMVDGDMTYPAEDMDRLIQPILNNSADIVVGDRHSRGDYEKENARPFHGFGNGLVKFLINFLFDANLMDVMSGYRAFNKTFVKNYPILVDGFEIETEMTLHSLQKKFRIVEVPIAYQDRPSGSESKLNTYSDGFRVLKTILWIFKDYRPLFFFGSLASIGFLLGLVTAAPVLYEFYLTEFIRHVPLAVLSSGIMIFSLLLLAVGLILDTVVKNNNAIYEQNLLNFGGQDPLNHS